MIEQYTKYTCVVRQRKEYKDRPLRESCEILEGIKLEGMLASWLMDEDDPYPGEFAMCPTRRVEMEIFAKAEVYWIASGDLEVKNER